jgi:hypothetical protein
MTQGVLSTALPIKLVKFPALSTCVLIAFS